LGARGFFCIDVTKGETMARKDWPDDWKAGNSSARVGLGCILIPVVVAVIAVITRQLWP
jgi:hypothetical protein